MCLYPGSSNGRTGGSGPPNRGSNPCPGTKLKKVKRKRPRGEPCGLRNVIPAE